MVVDVRQEFHALGARAAEERIVDDDSATTSGVCQRFDGFVDDPRRKEQREPVKNDKLDIIIDILSPSNYSEFTRVLNKGGVVIKVIPDEHYLKEIRSEIKGKIKKDTYSNKNVINLFKDNLEIIYDKRITYKTNIYNLEDFIKMTPLTSGLSKEQINELNKCDIEKITVDLKIIVGKVK